VVGLNVVSANRKRRGCQARLGRTPADIRNGNRAENLIQRGVGKCHSTGWGETALPLELGGKRNRLAKGAKNWRDS